MTLPPSPADPSTEPSGLDQTDVQLTDTGTFTVEDLDTSNVVNANSSFTGSAGTNTDPALDQAMTSSTSALPVIDAATTRTLLEL